MNPTDLQIYHNAAFDNGDSWSPVKPVSFDSYSSKENQSPLPLKLPSSVSIKTPLPVKPLHPNGHVISNYSQGKPAKGVLKTVPEMKIKEEVRDERKIDSEIVEVEMEISRLSSKLEALRLEKEEQKLKMLEKRGRFVSAKFMDPKQGAKLGDGSKRVEDILSNLSSKSRLQRRGVSMGPNEIAIAVKSRQLAKQEITPIQPIRDRRKSCFWKLQEIDELKVTKERGKSSSVSPKARKTMISKTPLSRQAVTTVGSKKAVKKEDISLIQPKKLFKEGEKSILAKKTMKPGRVVASRYSQGSVSNTNSAIRKRSLPENEKEEIKRCDKKRVSSTGSSCGSLPELGLNKGTEDRVKKRWEVTGEVVVHSSLEEDNDDDDNTPVSDLKVPSVVLPRIRTIRVVKESPRDSGPAKRVSELIGRKSYFSDDENVEMPVVQELNFGDDVEGK